MRVAFVIWVYERVKKLSTVCKFIKYTYLCTPKCKEFNNKIIYGNEKNISTFESKKKEQTWIPFKNGNSKRT